MRGPIDYIVLGFDGNKFDGSILQALEGAIDSGAIALVALSLVSKDESGSVTTIDIEQSGDDYVIAFAQKYHTSSDLVTSEDIDEVGELLENNMSAGLLAVEQLWAKPLKAAFISTGGYLLAEGRIHPEAAIELELSEEV